MFNKRRNRLLSLKYYKYILIAFCISLLIIFSHKIKYIKSSKYNFSSNYIIRKKTKVCLCVSGKKENKYIKEFVEHYKNIGVDKIFLYDNNSKKGERFENILSEYIKSKFVKIYNYRGKVSAQFRIYEKCYNKKKKNMIGLFFLILMNSLI